MRVGTYIILVIGLLSSAASCGKGKSEQHSTAPPESASETPPSSLVSATLAPSPSSSSAPQLPPPNLPPISSGVVINIEIENVPSGLPTVVGETNLPDGTELIFSLTDDVWRACDPERPCLDGRMLGDKGVVQRGRFRTIEFAKPPALMPGRWEAEVLAPLPFTQPPEVRAVIGEKGEKLRGKLIERTKSGPVVVAKKLFQVPVR